MKLYFYVLTLVFVVAALINIALLVNPAMKSEWVDMTILIAFIILIFSGVLARFSSNWKPIDWKESPTWIKMALYGLSLYVLVDALGNIIFIISGRETFLYNEALGFAPVLLLASAMFLDAGWKQTKS